MGGEIKYSPKEAAVWWMGREWESVACGENGCVGERNTEARERHTPTISWEMRCGVNGRMEGACEENAQAHKNDGGNEFD